MRRLAAIMFVDTSESAHPPAVCSTNNDGQLIKSVISDFQGQLIKRVQTGFVARFDSPVAALNSAIDLLQKWEGAIQPSVGIHIGDLHSRGWGTLGQWS